jgi:hypothetical protein
VVDHIVETPFLDKLDPIAQAAYARQCDPEDRIPPDVRRDMMETMLAVGFLRSQYYDADLRPDLKIVP